MANQQPPALQLSAPSAASIRLLPFWTNWPAAWFWVAEAYFTLKNVMGPDKQFLTVLTEEQADRVKAIVEVEPSATSFVAIRKSLVSSHSLTQFQQVDRLVNMEPLGHCKPTKLLVAIVKFRLAEDHNFFAYYFLQRLLQEVRVLLSGTCRPWQRRPTTSWLSICLSSIMWPPFHPGIRAI
jgi:hypothetical protein